MRAIFPMRKPRTKSSRPAIISRGRNCSPGPGRPKIINLSRSYNYQSKGYYASLLAEARGHRIIPTVETMLELREHKLYEHALPDLQEALNVAAHARPRQRDDALSTCCSASA